MNKTDTEDTEYIKDVFCISCGSSTRERKDARMLWAAKDKKTGRITARCNYCNTYDVADSIDALEHQRNFSFYF